MTLHRLTTASQPWNSTCGPFVRNGCSAVATKSSKLTCGHTADMVVFDIVVVSFDLNYPFSSLHRACVLTRWS